MISFQRYGDLFGAPEVRATVLASVIGRIPIGVATLAVLLFVQARTGSFALAGSTAALYVLGLSVVAPFLGRMIDRVGPRRVLSVSAVVYPGMLGALVLLVVHAESHWWVAAAALLAGAAFPPITICMRTLYPRLLPDIGLLQTAYSVDSALVETIFIAGPALVALFVAAGYPYAAVLFAAVCAAIGSAVFLRTPAVRNWAVHPDSAPRSLLGPLRIPRLLAVFAATVCYSVGFGLYEVAVTAFATTRGHPAAAGVILALASVGSTAGAVIYGSRDWGWPIARQYLLAVGLMAAGLLLLTPITNLTLFAFANIVAGVPMATVIAVQSLLVSQIAPRVMLAESFTWGATCLLGGISAGIAAGGMLAEYVPAATILAVAVAATLLSGAIVWTMLGERES
ncbi:MAG: MFS transporter [Betaproteobacteria bacterium]|nr:MFS transporter [Betaproteobacteria bacterium]